MYFKICYESSRKFSWGVDNLQRSTRESTNKGLRDFRERGWILVEQGHITILDPEALRAQITA